MRLEPRKEFSEAREKHCEINVAPNGMFILWTGPGLTTIATHASPQWLSDSALMSGALSVRWGFDLGILEPERYSKRR